LKADGSSDKVAGKIENAAGGARDAAHQSKWTDKGQTLPSRSRWERPFVEARINGLRTGLIRFCLAVGSVSALTNALPVSAQGVHLCRPQAVLYRALRPWSFLPLYGMLPTSINSPDVQAILNQAWQRIPSVTLTPSPKTGVIAGSIFLMVDPIIRQQLLQTCPQFQVFQQSARPTGPQPVRSTGTSGNP